jgi:hypothetical protein
MTVKVALELTELQLQIRGRPEQRAVETFAADRADQAFDEWMRQRHVRHRLDGCHVEDSQIRLPLVESVPRIMVRAEVGRRRLATHRSIEHLAQRQAVDDAAVHAEAHDAPGTLVHHDEHPMCAPCSRFAPKQIKTPQTVLRVTKHRQPGRPAESGVGWCRTARMRRTASLFMGIPNASVNWCAIRGHPQLGFRCFMSTTGAMTSRLGPLGPGLVGPLDEKSRRYFRCISAR